MELKWNGMELEWNWNGIGMELECNDVAFYSIGIEIKWTLNWN